MIFNSIDFVIFLPIVFVLYWFVFKKNLKLQNALLLIASYVFYGWWDWRFLSLIIFSTLVDFFVGKQLAISKKATSRKLLLWVSIVCNLGLLGFFKYYNFFLDNFQQAFSFFGREIGIESLKIILPVGISFYTFQTLSYTIDIYRNKLKPTQDFIAFGAFVSFFPQLVAGPIERASNLLPQIVNKRNYSFEQIKEGIKLIVYGFFLKVFIADTLAPVVNEIFENYDKLSGGTLMLGALYFSLQIYGDFAGYSKIARGVAKLFGFELMLNFDFPYFSRNIGEFWRKWHISLNTWFRDYLYIPLGGSRKGKYRGMLNVFIIFLVSGFWHGANWTFIAWGFIHASLFIPSFLLGTNRKHTANISTSNFSIKTLLSILQTFLVVTFAWIFFRANSISEAISYIQHINFEFEYFLRELIIVGIWLVVDFIFFRKKDTRIFYIILIGAILAASILTEKAEFIYFQF